MTFANSFKIRVETFFGVYGPEDIKGKSSKEVGLPLFSIL